MAAGANIALKDKQGLTATDLAKKSEDVQLHQYLESKSQQLNFSPLSEVALDYDSFSSDTLDNTSGAEEYDEDRNKTASSLAIRHAYEEIAKRFSNYPIASDGSQSDSSTSIDENHFDNHGCTCRRSSDFMFTHDCYKSIPSSPNVRVGTDSEGNEHFSEFSFAVPTKIDHGKSRNGVEYRGYECLDCKAKVSVDQDSDLNSIVDDESTTDQSNYEFNIQQDLSIISSEVFEKKTNKRNLLRVISNYDYSSCQPSDFGKSNEFPLAPVHAKPKPLKSIIKNSNSSRKFDARKGSKSRLSRSLRISESVEYSDCHYNIRKRGGSLRVTNNISSTQFGGSQNPIIPYRLPTMPTVVDQKNNKQEKNNKQQKGFKTSLVLALAAAHASTFALAFNPKPSALVEPMPPVKSKISVISEHPLIQSDSISSEMPVLPTLPAVTPPEQMVIEVLGTPLVPESSLIPDLVAHAHLLARVIADVLAEESKRIALEKYCQQRKLMRFLNKENNRERLIFEERLI